MTTIPTMSTSDSTESNNNTVQRTNKHQITDIKMEPLPDTQNRWDERNDNSVCKAVTKFSCHVCEAVFNRKCQLNYHQESVHGHERLRQCPICGKGHFRLLNLKTHINSHLGTDKSTCQTCGRKFNHVSNLMRHARTHFGVKPYLCTTCGKRFTQINTLARHKATHNEWNLSCYLCDKPYKTESSLRTHAKTIHGINNQDFKTMFRGNISTPGNTRRQYYCKICGARFRFAHWMEIHEKEHQDVISIKCENCNNTFDTIDKLKEHRRVHVCDLGKDNMKLPASICRTDITGNSRLKDTHLGASDDNDDDSEQNDLVIDFGAIENPEFHCFIPLQMTNDHHNTDGSCNPNSNHVVATRFVPITADQCSTQTSVEPMIDSSDNFSRDKLINPIVEGLQPENTNTCQYTGEAAVSDMMNNYWEEIEPRDLNKFVQITSDKIDLQYLNTQSASRTITNLGSYREQEFRRIEQIGSFNIPQQSEHPSITPGNCIGTSENSNGMGKRNNQESSYNSPLENSSKVQHIQTGTFPLGSTNSTMTNDIIEELFVNQITGPIESSNERQGDSGDVVAVVGTSVNGEEKISQSQEVNKERQLYELIVSNLVKNLGASDTRSGFENNKNLGMVINEEFLLKVFQLENRKHILGIVRNHSSNESDNQYPKIRIAGTDDGNVRRVLTELIRTMKNLGIPFHSVEGDCTADPNHTKLNSDECARPTSLTDVHNAQSSTQNKCSTSNSAPLDNAVNEDLFGLIHTSPSTCDDCSNTEAQKAPMVRLVQNEDGAQFFELIRADTELDDVQDSESSMAQDKPLAVHQMHFPNSTIEDTARSNMPTTTVAKSEAGNEGNPRTTTIRERNHKSAPKKFVCHVCNKSFSKYSNYKQHCGTHSGGEQKHKCEKCGMSFAWRPTLNKHMAVHKAGGQQKFVCEICPKVYTTLAQVKDHVKRDHLKERNHRCQECSKAFFKKSDLKLHIRTHTNERPYVCQICDRSFPHRSHFIRHKRFHSGEKPYSCDTCQKTFMQLVSLRTHKQRYHESKIDILDYQMDENDPVAHNQTTL